MAKMTEMIMRTNFGKKLKQMVILSVCVFVLGGGASALLLRTQIGEAVSQAQTWEQTDWEEYSGGYHWKEREGYGDREYTYFEERDFTELQFTEPTLAARIAVGITGAAYMLLGAAFWLLIAAWLYQAASRSDMNSLLWLLLGLAGNVFAALLFVVIRSFIRKKCPSCGQYQPIKTQWCTKCGAALEKKCPKCGADCGLNDTFCHACGAKIGESGQ